MPKQKITKEMVVDAAFELARTDGMEAIMVKNISERLGCSVQPIYSYCRNMKGLHQDVRDKVREFVRDFVGKRTDPQNIFRSTGRAYIQMAKEEPNIFKMSIQSPREGITSFDDLYQAEASECMAEIIAEELHISASQAKQLHLNMLIFTMGLGAIFSVTSPGIDVEEIFKQQETVYEALLQQTLAKEQ